MTPEEKAKELIERFSSKQDAVRAANEVIQNIQEWDNEGGVNHFNYEWWQQVKSILEKRIKEQEQLKIEL